jgi:hypothetical protein
LSHAHTQRNRIINEQVRVAFYTAVSSWMLTLKERFDYETLLMPYVLSGR